MDKRRQKSGSDTTAPPRSDGEDQADVGARLRAMYKAVEAAPVPDELSRLVVELQKKHSRRRPRAH